MSAAINVNLDRSCYCERFGVGAEQHHTKDCPGAPVPIHCPLPRSFVVEVEQGECKRDPFGCKNGHHASVCFAQTVRVSCSIDGTWGGSEPVDFDDGGATFTDVQLGEAEDACRERWALVKALVLGFTRVTLGGVSRKEADALFTQRDAVFAALAKMARHEAAAYEAHAHFQDALGISRYDWTPVGYVTPEGAPLEMPSACGMAAYVRHLLKQVEELP